MSPASLRPERHLPHSDPGLQPERTVQSWLRTALSLTVVSLVFLRWIDHFHLYSVIVFVACLAMAITAVAMQARRYRIGASSIRAERGRPTPLAILIMAGATCLIALLGMATVFSLTY